MSKKNVGLGTFELDFYIIHSYLSVHSRTISYGTFEL